MTTKQFTRGGTSIPHHWLGDRDDSDVEIGMDALVSENSRTRLGWGGSEFVSKPKKFMARYNGAYWHHGVVEHYCSGPACCAGREACIAEMKLLAHQTLLRDVPLTPACNKWTKLGPCVDSVPWSSCILSTYFCLPQLTLVNHPSTRTTTHHHSHAPLACAPHPAIRPATSQANWICWYGHCIFKSVWISG